MTKILASPIFLKQLQLIHTEILSVSSRLQMSCVACLFFLLHSVCVQCSYSGLFIIVFIPGSHLLALCFKWVGMRSVCCFKEKILECDISFSNPTGEIQPVGMELPNLPYPQSHLPESSWSQDHMGKGEMNSQRGSQVAGDKRSQTSSQSTVG